MDWVIVFTSFPLPWIISSLAPWLWQSELVNSSVYAPICSSSVLFALKHSQNNDEHNHEQGEKLTRNIVCQNNCVKDITGLQNTRQLGEEELIHDMQGIASAHSFLTFRNVSIYYIWHCIFTFLLLKFSKYTLKCKHPVKMS